MRLIRLPGTTLFHQVFAYLRAKPDPPRSLSGSMVGREGVAATAVILRWGPYLAILLDQDKPVWPEVNSASTSRISDDEMARINIEASAALAEWIDIHRTDPGGPQYKQLVDRAVYYLPMPKKTSKFRATEFAALAVPAIAARVVRAAPIPLDASVRAQLVPAGATLRSGRTSDDHAVEVDAHGVLARAAFILRYPTVSRQLSAAAIFELLLAATWARVVSANLRFSSVNWVWRPTERHSPIRSSFLLMCGLGIFVEACPPRHFLDHVCDQRVFLLHILQAGSFATCVRIFDARPS